MSQGKTRSEIEAEWRVRIQEAQGNYRQAVQYHQHMLEELDQRLLDGPDGIYAVAKAKRAMVLAMHEILRREKILMDLVLRNSMPPEDDDEKLLI